ncbi:MAG: Tat pathway signal protein, partial [Burkholderiales bacterium PBB5]
MAKEFESMEDSNRSGNASVHEVSDPARRQWLQGGLGAAMASAFGPLAASLAGCASAAGAAPKLGFKPIAASTADTVVVPEGYVAEAIAPWGDPVGIDGAMPAFKPDASNSAADQALQLGMHHDGLHFYPLGEGAERSRRGLLAMNHEYTDDGLLHTDGMANWSAEKVRKAQAAHGVGVIEVALSGGQWQVV